MKPLSFFIPHEVTHVTNTLSEKGFESYLVGGCVRDLLLGRKPKDWDITTNATPEEIISSFPKTFYENSYGTVGVVIEDATDETVKVIEVTPYRTESGYSNKRHPDTVSWSKNVLDDLKRRDFTINAFAYDPKKGLKQGLIDEFTGIRDLADKTIRVVGNPDERFGEDALRILRAVRLAVELGFHVEPETEQSLKKNAHLLSHIAKERIQTEFSRIIMSAEPMRGIEYCHTLDILKHIAPELEEGIGMEQNQAHSFDVWTHTLKTLQHAADKNFPLEIRLAALFHDIGKPRTRRFSHETKQYTFYGHEVVGAKMAQNILERLKFSRETSQKVIKLVRWHMFFSDTETITLSAVRRMVANVGRENIWDLMNVRICDRIGTGRPKESPYRLRKYKAMIEEAVRSPISVAMLNIKGEEIMSVANIGPSPKIGLILNALLEEVLENPEKNEKTFLVKRVQDLVTLEEKDLIALAKRGKESKEILEKEAIKEIRTKHGVK